jgi:hypothetical protein
MEGREPRSGERGGRRAAAHNLSAKREARARAAGVTFMQQCIHDATLEEERAAQRRLKEGGRAAAEDRARQAHNLCVYNPGEPATICRIDLSRFVDLAS